MAVTGYRRDVTGSNPVSPYARFLFSTLALCVLAQTKKAASIIDTDG